MSENQQEIFSLIIPMRAKSVLLPNKAVAEIVPYIDSESAPEGHMPWHIGFLNWRGERLPVVSFEKLYDESFPPLDRRLKMVAIINTQLGLKEMPHIGIGVEGIPRLGRVTPEFIEENPESNEPDPQNVIASKVLFNNREMLIPDIKELEKIIQEQI
jgi:chemosensory pili system protein ChpC